jgi:hypothetical protein
MGLLDALNTYEGQQGLGLLAAAGPRFDNASFFQRLQEGMGSADKWKREQAKAELEKLQVEEYKRKVAQEQLDQQQALVNKEAIRNQFIPMSGGQAMANGQGPTLANTQNLGQMPKFDPATFFQQNPNADVSALKGAVDINQMMNPARELMSVPENNVVIDKRTGQSVFTAPTKPKEIDPNKPFYMVDGKITPNPDFQAFDLSKSKASATHVNTNAINNVNAFEPFKNKVQGEMGTNLVKSFDTLQNIPQTIQALDAAKATIPNAKNFLGSGGETKLAIAKFFNSNLGTSIDPSGVADVETLKSQLFYNIMDNLKKMDASPSQQQQQKMSEAFGNINTDPKALPQIIDFYRSQVTSKAKEHNRRVDQTLSGPSGIQFPYDIHIDLPKENASKTVVGTGTYYGKKVNKYSDGRVYYAN